MSRPSAKKPNQENLNSFVIQGGAGEGDLKVRRAEDSGEKKHRHKMETRAFWVKEAPTHLTAMGIVIVAAFYCFWVLWQTNRPVADREWAMSRVSYLLVAIVGFAFGKVAK